MWICYYQEQLFFREQMHGDGRRYASRLRIGGAGANVNKDMMPYEVMVPARGILRIEEYRFYLKWGEQGKKL